MQWIHNPSQSNVDDLNNVRRDATRRFRNKKKAYLKAKIEELETNSKIKNIRDLCRSISDFTEGYQPRCNIVKDEKVDLAGDCHSILARWRNYFSQILNIKIKQPHYRPGQAQRVLRKLRFPDFVTTEQDGGRLSALRTGSLYSQEILLVLISVRG